MRLHRQLILVAIMLITAMAWVIPAVQIARDWAYIDLNTGSRKGHREWSFGWRTGSWYRASALEVFMRSNHPGQIQQHWVSYAGTGRNIFGGATLHGHGRPGPIILLEPEAIEGYCQIASQTEKRALYDVFASGDDAKIREWVDRIPKTSMTPGKTESDGAPNRGQPTRVEPNRQSVTAPSDR